MLELKSPIPILEFRCASPVASTVHGNVIPFGSTLNSPDKSTFNPFPTFIPPSDVFVAVGRV